MWNVMRRTRSDGKASLDAFGRHYPRNAREVQPQNDRKIE
jgi:carbonic anhydrase